MANNNSGCGSWPHPILPPQYVCTDLYTVKAGDTLYSISQQYGVPVAILMQANRILNPYNLTVGQRICIPGPMPQEPVCRGTLYTVQPGDSLYMISRKFGLTLDAVLVANPGLDPYNLRVGMRLCLPIHSPETPVPLQNEEQR
ncbi:MAG: LysM peptidoglycan-binding domain-containing protein [Clostridiales bacterium]|nr:LysM peptidoglycan-binding domain-containing protein [Clostridiales bacterium]